MSATHICLNYLKKSIIQVRRWTLYATWNANVNESLNGWNTAKKLRWRKHPTDFDYELTSNNQSHYSLLGDPGRVLANAVENNVSSCVAWSNMGDVDLQLLFRDFFWSFIFCLNGNRTNT